MALLSPFRCLVVLLASACLASGQSRALDEYQIKAAFLYNFAKFVEWPVGSFKSPTDPITICVLGDPFGSRLEDIVRGKAIEERRLLVRAISDVSEVSGCHILFIAADKRRSANLFNLVKASPTLTVGESANFASSGGIVGFKLENDKVALEINIHAAEAAGLRISSRLLSLAAIVKGGR